MSGKGYRFPPSPWHCFYYSFNRNNEKSFNRNNEKYKGINIVKAATESWGKIKNTRLDNHLEITKTFDYWEKVAERVKEYQNKQYYYYFSINKNMRNCDEIPEQNFDYILKECLIFFGGREDPKVQKFKINVERLN